MVPSWEVVEAREEGAGVRKGEKQNQAIDLVEFADLPFTKVETAELQALSDLQVKGAPSLMGERCLSCPQTPAAWAPQGKLNILPSWRRNSYQVFPPRGFPSL